MTNSVFYDDFHDVSGRRQLTEVSFLVSYNPVNIFYYQTFASLILFFFLTRCPPDYILHRKQQPLKTTATAFIIKDFSVEGLISIPQSILIFVVPKFSELDYLTLSNQDHSQVLIKAKKDLESLYNIFTSVNYLKVNARFHVVNRVQYE